MSRPIVHFDGVRFAWPRANDFSLEIDDFSVQSGESILLLGPSGSGKSTFLSLLCGIVKPEIGTVSVLGQNLAKLSNAARDRFRAEHFGIIFQMFNLLPYGSVLDNVTLPLRFASGRRKNVEASGTIEDEAQRLLTHLGIDTGSKGRAAASDLSVGQQQRVAAARALIGRPDVIIADEPTSSLDRNRQDDFLRLLFDELKTSGATLLMVSHDESLGDRFDRVVDLAAIATSKRKAAL